MNRREGGTKDRLTVTIDHLVLQRAKEAADRKRIPLSRLIENFLAFFATPEVYCFNCGEQFQSTETDLCLKCGWMRCPKCTACGCSVSEETAAAIFYMRKVYEDLLAGRIKR
ncbi:MAG: hypothetical protein EFT35_01425 [Methanophagales archaeon ANME-1-THS]|nr:MAG: hypothetical protein EFT35_01425 [Methanophagales archaeon ANME-1-THS]